MARRAALIAGAGAALLLVVLLIVPFVTRERRFSGTFPQPEAVAEVSLVRLRGAERACLSSAVVDERSEIAQLRVGTFGRATQPLRLTIAGEGYRQDIAIPAGDWQENELMSIPLEAPPEPVETRICVENAGRRPIALYGTADRAKTRSVTKVDGAAVPANFAIRFAEAENASFAARAGDVFERIEVFRPGVVSAWMLWVVAVLTAVGVPVAVFFALVRGLRDDERD